MGRARLPWALRASSALCLPSAKGTAAQNKDYGMGCRVYRAGRRGTVHQLSLGCGGLQAHATSSPGPSRSHSAETCPGMLVTLLCVDSSGEMWSPWLCSQGRAQWLPHTPPRPQPSPSKGRQPMFPDPRCTPQGPQGHLHTARVRVRVERE